MVDTDQDALAAEYVLGTLSADERDQAEALLGIDPGFARAVRQWERRLGELNVMVEAVEPAPEVWDKIRSQINVPSGDDRKLPEVANIAPEPAKELEHETEPSPADDVLASSILPPSGEEEEPEGVSESVTASLAESLSVPSAERERSVPVVEPEPARGADTVYLSRRVRRWRRVSFFMTAIAAVLALYIGGMLFAPDMIPLVLRSPAQLVARSGPPATRPPAQLAGVLQQDPVAPAFLLTVDTQSRTLTVRRISAAPDTGHSYELWLISSRFPSPRSLGLVGKDEFTQRPLPANYDLATVQGASYAVSLEPVAGSPSGVPTGPVLFTGKLVESAPPPPPPTPKT